MLWLIMTLGPFPYIANTAGWLTAELGRQPWVVYGLMRKTAALGAVEGLTLETLLLAPFALAYLLWLSSIGQSDFAQGDPATTLLLVAAGPVTAAPLLLFAAGARRIPVLGKLISTWPVSGGVIVHEGTLYAAAGIAGIIFWLKRTGWTLTRPPFFASKNSRTWATA
jgi:hypothetical protein